jgi:tetratricopeptide (TPR) repeat protein
MFRDGKQLRNKLITQARQDVRRGDFRSAHRRYKRLSGLEPDNPSFHIKLADVALRLDRKEESIEAYMRGAALFTRDAFEEKAIGVLKRALEIDPDRADISERIANAYQRLGRPKDAMATLSRAVDMLVGRGQAAEALRLRREIARVDSSDLSGRLQLAHELEMQGMESDAVSEYAEAIVEAAVQGEPERIAGAFRAILALEPAEVEELAANGDGETETRLDEAYACRAHHQTLEVLYRRVAEAYRRRHGVAAAP